MNKPVTEIYFLRQMNFKKIVAYAFRYKLNEKFVRSKRIRLTARLRYKTRNEIYVTETPIWLLYQRCQYHGRINNWFTNEKLYSLNSSSYYRKKNERESIRLMFRNGYRVANAYQAVRC